jgi:hypothetical protein
MASINTSAIARVYLVILLIMSILLSSPIQLGISLALLVIQLYSAYKPPRAGLNLILVTGTLLLIPVVFPAFIGGGVAVLLILPVLLLLDRSLKDFTSAQNFRFKRSGRSASDTLKRLTAGLLLAFAVAVVAWNFNLALTTVVLMGYLGVSVALVFRSVPKSSLAEEKTWRRLVVGESETVKFNVKGKAARNVLVSLKPTDSWVHVEPTSFTLPKGAETNVTIRFAPPLAGPSKVQIQGCFVDQSGLVETGQVLEPVDLHIIPRAKYAAWLAKKFLEQTVSGGGKGEMLPGASARAVKQGVEFYGCRVYQSGDRLRDIDWKHSYMLGNLIVKEFTGSQGQVGIIVADLTASSAEDADLLAFNLVMSALTLAREGFPSALAVYNNREVLAATQVLNARETLKLALELTEKITIVESKEKVLEPTEMRRLNRSVALLRQVDVESAEKLSNLLELEIEANLEMARLHPATLALAKVIKNMQGPAVITVVSSASVDSEALLFGLERLQQKGYRTVQVHA